MTTARSGRPRSCATPAMVTALVTCSGDRVSEEPDTGQSSDTAGPPALSHATPTRTAAATGTAGHPAPPPRPPPGGPARPGGGAAHRPPTRAGRGPDLRLGPAVRLRVDARPVAGRRA